MNLCDEYGIRKITTTAEHPQADPAERTIRTVKQILKKLTLNFKDWDEETPKALAAMRWHINKSTAFTPYQIVFGRKPVLPGYLELESFNLNNPSNRAMKEKEITDYVKKHLREAAEENKLAYDKRNYIKDKNLLIGREIVFGVPFGSADGPINEVATVCLISITVRRQSTT